MAEALLTSHPEFERLLSGHWALRADASPFPSTGGGNEVTARDAAGDDAAPLSLRNVPFAVVDVETTGSRAGAGDRITEIAIVRVCGGAIVDVYAQLVNPERSIPPFITQLTQISWAMVKDQPCFRDVAGEVTKRLSGHVFAAHNAAFDWKFVSEELSHGVGHRLSGPRLCTVRMAKVMLPALTRRSLDHVARHFGIEFGSRHRAEGDAFATATALLRMLDVAAEQGITCWNSLHRRLTTPSTRRRQKASDRRRRAFPLPASEDHIA